VPKWSNKGSYDGDSCSPRDVGALSPFFSMFSTPSLSDLAFLSAFLECLKALKHFHIGKSITSVELSMMSRMQVFIQYMLLDL